MALDQTLGPGGKAVRITLYRYTHHPNHFVRLESIEVEARGPKTLVQRRTGQKDKHISREHHEWRPTKQDALESYIKNITIHIASLDDQRRRLEGCLAFARRQLDPGDGYGGTR